MPTGYTSGVNDGTIANTADYIATCARGFGAYITMRDEPLNAEPPEEFKPSDYHVNELQKAKLKLEELKCLTSEEIQERIAEDYNAKVEKNQKYIRENGELLKRYEDMLIQVKLWEPPTDEHVKLKEFCVSQLKDSIKWDCPTDGSLSEYCAVPTELESVESWLNRKSKSYKKDIEYHTKEWEEEVKRINERNLWINQLKDSLKNLDK